MKPKKGAERRLEQNSDFCILQKKGVSRSCTQEALGPQGGAHLAGWGEVMEKASRRALGPSRGSSADLEGSLAVTRVPLGFGTEFSPVHPCEHAGRTQGGAGETWLGRMLSSIGTCGIWRGSWGGEHLV